jgi:hypothetical protein
MLERQAQIVEESAEALYHLFVLGGKCRYLATYIQCDLLGVGCGPKIGGPWCSDDDSENRLVRVGFAGNKINILSIPQ